MVIVPSSPLLGKYVLCSCAASIFPHCTSLGRNWQYIALDKHFQTVQHFRAGKIQAVSSQEGHSCPWDRHAFVGKLTPPGSSSSPGSTEAHRKSKRRLKPWSTMRNHSTVLSPQTGSPELPRKEQTFKSSSLTIKLLSCLLDTSCAFLFHSSNQRRHLVCLFLFQLKDDLFMKYQLNAKHVFKNDSILWFL
jgi:hypothetical protein